MRGTKKLTPLAWALIRAFIFIVIVAAMAFGYFKFFKKDTGIYKKEETVKTTEMNYENNDEDISAPVKTDKTNTINLAVDEWVGYIPIVKGKAAGIYEKHGIDLNLYVINDATQSSNALIKGELDGAGYTINRLAFLSNKFTSSKVDVVMPYITNYSNGGDGIIALSSINTIDDLVNARIGVPQFSESQAMIVWFVNQSNLSQEEKNKVINDLILFETAEESAKAFFAGKIDVAGTWQPYLTQAENMTDSHILFSTADSTKLIMSGVVFRKDFAERNHELISGFIDATLEASKLYDTTEYLQELKQVMPMFDGMTDNDIIAMTHDARLTTWKDNMNILKEDATFIYNNMCDVWTSIGESVDKSVANDLFDISYMKALSDKYDGLIANDNSSTENKVVVTEENKIEILNTDALLTKSATVTFVISTAKFKDPAAASASLNSFIEVAKILDGAIIQIEGNTDPNPNSDPTDAANIMLSKNRAETVKQYFIANGIDSDRIITVGNGSSKPIVENDTEEHKAMNRRTDVSFKLAEQ